MANKKIGTYMAAIEHDDKHDDDIPRFSTAAKALADEMKNDPVEGDVIYVYQLVDVRVVRESRKVTAEPFNG